jgi:hypothetical protein
MATGTRLSRAVRLFAETGWGQRTSLGARRLALLHGGTAATFDAHGKRAGIACRTLNVASEWLAEQHAKREPYAWDRGQKAAERWSKPAQEHHKQDQV